MAPFSLVILKDSNKDGHTLKHCQAESIIFIRILLKETSNTLRWRTQRTNLTVQIFHQVKYAFLFLSKLKVCFLVTHVKLEDTFKVMAL